MRSWLIILGGMLVWTVHFFALYALASILGSSLAARIGTGLVTLACLGADAWLLVLAGRWSRAGAETPAWVGAVGRGMAAVSIVAVLYQGLPAILA